MGIGIMVCCDSATIPGDRHLSHAASDTNFGKFTFRGMAGVGHRHLLAGVLIGQLGITISQPLKPQSSSCFCFAVGYGVGPQFVAGRQGWVPQALFAVVHACSAWESRSTIVKLVGYDLGYAAGFNSGSQTISEQWASRPTLSIDWAWPPTKPRSYLTPCLLPMPSPTVRHRGSAIVIALLGTRAAALRCSRRV